MKQKYHFFLKRFLYYFYGEKFYKRLSFEWKNYPSRVDIIKKIIKNRNYKTYLEIGCDNDQNFSQISIDKKVGVDPLKGGTLRMTSDEFFLRNNDFFDIIFFDGLNTYEQTIIDIENLLRFFN